MKTICTMILALLFVGAANAAINCKGIQEAKGLRGSLQFVAREVLALEYSSQNMVERKCVFQLDKTYRPRNSSPKKDRYVLTKQSTSCKAQYVWMSKTLLTSGSGFVDIEFSCGSGGGCAHGEAGPIDSFICSK